MEGKRLINNLYKEVAKKGPVCLGLDTDIGYIPKKIRDSYSNIGDLLFNYNKTIIDASHDLVAVFKLQIAYYERYGIEGLLAYKRTLEYIKSLGSLSIGDIKRGDIASSATMYSKAHFEGDFETDIVTLNPYMGYETLDPFLEYLDKGKGIFVLLRTSNSGSKDIEYKRLKETDEYLYYSVGDSLQKIGKRYMTKSGYSNLGLVVGAVNKEDGKDIRERYRDMFFLIPGYGYQGGQGEDVKLYLNQGNGGVVNSSRGIVLSYKNKEDGEERFEEYIRQAVMDMKGDLL